MYIAKLKKGSEDNDMARRENNRNRKSNDQSNNRSNKKINSRSIKSNPEDSQLLRAGIEGEGIIREVRDRLFGIDPNGSAFHKQTWQDVRTQLVNVKFYFDNASQSINQILETMDTVQHYDQERSKYSDNINTKNVTERSRKNT